MSGAAIPLALEALSKSGTLRLRASGGSMLPAIAPGDLLTFRTSELRDCAPGDVLLVRRQQRLVAHRMVGTQDGMILTRGDALEADDAPVDPRDVVGLLAVHLRGDRALPTGGRHWLRRQRVARWAIRHVAIVGHAFRRLPALAALVS